MTQMVSLKNGKSFNVPEGYHIEITTDIVYDDMAEEVLKYGILVITNDSDSVADEDVKERYYVLSEVVAYGDCIEGCP